MLLLVTLVPPFKWTENVSEHRVTRAPGELAHEYLSSLPSLSRYFCNLSTSPFYCLRSIPLFHRRNILITCHASTRPDLVLEPRQSAVRSNSFSNTPEVSQAHSLPYSETNISFTTNRTLSCPKPLSLGECKCYLCKKSGALFSRV